jgi:MOSC domain-containing protein YiiM
VQQIGDEVGFALDKRRFRANVYADLMPMSGFAENAFLGRRLQIGTKAVIAVTDRDPRCKMITLDPNTAQASPEVLRRVRDSHEGKAGLYGAVLVEGTVRPGDEIRLLD